MTSARTIAVVGTGSVGVAAAYSLFANRVASELFLVDKDHGKAEGEAMDLMHGQALVGRISVRAALYAELTSASIVIVTAGRNQKRDESRLDLLRGNAETIREIVGQLDVVAPDAIVIVATNPVDVLTRVALQTSKRAPHRILGTGTTLDSARFRALIADEFGVSPRAVHAHVLGEHGDSQVPIWSSACIGGTRIDDLASDGGESDGSRLSRERRTEIEERTRGAARAIIERKGRTDLAIGTVLSYLAAAILSDERSIQPLSVPLDGEFGIHDVCMSLPCVLGRDGLGQRVLPVLDAKERAALVQSGEVLRAAARGASIP